MQTSASMRIKLPRGETATFEEMQAYGDTLQQFIREQEAALPAIQSATEHNQIIDYLQLLADGYNEQLRAFKAAESCRQRILLVLMAKVGGS
ncbi:MAG: hypothetical protein Hals2KO_15990 [Halioglobus sp.]